MFGFIKALYGRKIHKIDFFSLPAQAFTLSVAYSRRLLQRTAALALHRQCFRRQSRFGHAAGLAQATRLASRPTASLKPHAILQGAVCRTSSGLQSLEMHICHCMLAMTSMNAHQLTSLR